MLSLRTCVCVCVRTHLAAKEIEKGGKKEREAEREDCTVNDIAVRVRIK